MSTRRLLLVPLLLAAACGPDEADFQPAYTEALCRHVLQCGDPALLTYDGTLDIESCVVQREREVALWGAGCRYRASRASQCLADMDALVCPTIEGQLAGRPDSCSAVYTQCGESPVDDTDGEDPIEQPEETGGGEETGSETGTP